MGPCFLLRLMIQRQRLASTNLLVIIIFGAEKTACHFSACAATTAPACFFARLRTLTPFSCVSIRYPFAYTPPIPDSLSTLDNLDLIITLGGDGTILHVASLFDTPGKVPPVLSFSMGSLGFLLPFRESFCAGSFERYPLQKAG